MDKRLVATAREKSKGGFTLTRIEADIYTSEGILRVWFRGGRTDKEEAGGRGSSTRQ